MLVLKMCWLVSVKYQLKLTDAEKSANQYLTDT